MTGRGAAGGPGPRRRHAAAPPGYWLLAGLLIGFGLLGILSIGIPFLVQRALEISAPGMTLEFNGAARSRQMSSRCWWFLRS